MINIINLIYSWISFHGITDMLYPLQVWLPMYSLSVVSVIIPQNILNSITLVSSSIHFSYDLSIHPLHFLLILSLLLFWGEYQFSQAIILAYMSFVHVPLHFIYLTEDLSNVYSLLLLIGTYIGFYNCNLLMNTLHTIIRSGGRLPNNKIHRVLLGFINAHIATNYLMNNLQNNSFNFMKNNLTCIDYNFISNGM